MWKNNQNPNQTDYVKSESPKIQALAIKFMMKLMNSCGNIGFETLDWIGL